MKWKHWIGYDWLRGALPAEGEGKTSVIRSLDELMKYNQSVLVPNFCSTS